MKPIEVLLLVTGDITPSDLLKIGPACDKVFENLGYDFTGEVVLSSGLKYVSYPDSNVFGLRNPSTIWIIGLDPLEWYGDNLRSLKENLKNETGILVLSPTN